MLSADAVGKDYNYMVLDKKKTLKFFSLNLTFISDVFYILLQPAHP